jgi:hypothetical protein
MTFATLPEPIADLKLDEDVEAEEERVSAMAMK